MASAASLPDTLASSPLQMVVIGQFLSHSNVSQGKYTYAGLSIDEPLLCFAVGLAGMIDEARSVALPGGINDFQGTAHPHRVLASIRHNQWSHAQPLQELVLLSASKLPQLVHATLVCLAKGV